MEGSIRIPACRVLVVDDNPDACDSTAMLLHYKGYEARTALTGHQAILRVASFAPDIVLLDIEMPGMNGLEVARAIRETKGIKDPIIAAVSGFESIYQKRLCATAGFDYYLLKPVDPVAFDQLRWFMRREHAVAQDFRILKRERASVCYALCISQLEFGGLLFDVAAAAKSASTGERCFERVRGLEEGLSTYLAKEKGFSSDQTNTLQILLAGLQVRLITMRNAA